MLPPSNKYPVRNSEIILREGNIPIVAVEREARIAIVQGMTARITVLWDDFVSKNYAGDIHDDEWTEDRFDLVDKFREDLIRNKIDFAKVLMNYPSRALSKIATQYGERCMVQVVIREYTDDAHKAAGGYFIYNTNAAQYMIRCFVDEYRAMAAAEQIIQHIVFGEYYDDGVDEFLQRVVPIFVHEFVHLQQELRNPHRPSQNGDQMDLGIITVGGGKRGNRRTPKAGRVEWARYTGSLMEIEAFAAQTAVEMLQHIKPHGMNKDHDNDQIDGLLDDIAQGWGSGNAFNAMNQMRTYWEDFKAIGVDEKERDLVWKRYLKLVYKNVWQFRRKHLGKTPAYSRSEIENAPEDWLAWTKHGMVVCATAIAMDVATKESHNLDTKTPEQIASDTLAWQASRFVELYFFGESENYEDGLKVNLSMRKLIKKELEKYA